MLEAIIRTAEQIYPEAVFAVHLDHGDEATCYECIDSCFYSSVMIDASHEPFEKQTKAQVIQDFRSPNKRDLKSKRPKKKQRIDSDFEIDNQIKYATFSSVNDEIKIPEYPTITFDSLPPVFWLDLAIERLEALSRVDKVQAQKLGTALVSRLREVVERLC